MTDHTNTLITILVVIGIGMICGWLFRIYRRLCIHRLLEFLDNFISRSPESVALITYRHAIQYYVKELPADSRIRNGAILLEIHDEGYLFTQVFLDGKFELVLKPDGAPYGRKFLVKELDAELKTAFAREKAYEGKKVLFVSGVSRLLERTSEIPMMTYTNALKYFSVNAPSITEASKGAMLLQRGLKRHIFQQVFLDEKDDLLCSPSGKPYGRQCYVIDIDERLKNLFGNRSFIILEEKKPPSVAHLNKETTNSPATNNAANHIAESPAASKNEGGAKTLLTDELMPSSPGSEEENGILTYRAALTYFVTERPPDRRIRKGAIQLFRHRKGYVVQQFFLDVQNEPVCGPKGKLYGRTLNVKDLDVELWETFNGKQLIIVE